MTRLAGAILDGSGGGSPLQTIANNGTDLPAGTFTDANGDNPLQIVNAVTGETRVSRFLGSFDCGRIINAKTAASQFRGRIINPGLSTTCPCTWTCRIAT